MFPKKLSIRFLTEKNCPAKKQVFVFKYCMYIYIFLNLRICLYSLHQKVKINWNFSFQNQISFKSKLYEYLRRILFEAQKKTLRFCFLSKILFSSLNVLILQNCYIFLTFLFRINIESVRYQKLYFEHFRF